MCASTPSYPTKVKLAASVAHSDNDNNATIITSNRLCKEISESHHALSMLVGPSLAIADIGATSFFLTKGAPCQNKQQAVNPITVKLPNGCKIKSMHICDIIIPGLPTALTGHIMPDMTTASLLAFAFYTKRDAKSFSTTTSVKLLTIVKLS